MHSKCEEGSSAMVFSHLVRGSVESPKDHFNLLFIYFFNVDLIDLKESKTWETKSKVFLQFIVRRGNPQNGGKKYPMKWYNIIFMWIEVWLFAKDGHMLLSDIIFRSNFIHTSRIEVFLKCLRGNTTKYFCCCFSPNRLFHFYWLRDLGNIW